MNLLEEPSQERVSALLGRAEENIPTIKNEDVRNEMAVNIVLDVYMRNYKNFIERWKPSIKEMVIVYYEELRKFRDGE